MPGLQSISGDAPPTGVLRRPRRTHPCVARMSWRAAAVMAWVAAEEAIGEVWHNEAGTGRRKWSVGRVGGGGERVRECSSALLRPWMRLEGARRGVGWSRGFTGGRESQMGRERAQGWP